MCRSYHANIDSYPVIARKFGIGRSVSDIKKNKDKILEMRVTFMLCANAAVTRKLQWYVVGKSKKLRAFKHVFLFVIVHKNAWVTKYLFLEWFTTEFVPAVRRHLLSVNLPPQVLLLLDNCPGHSSAHEIVSEDGNIFAMFLPPNTTACIQPINQNVIQNVKINYRKSLLVNWLALCSENLMDTSKSITLKDTVFLLANCWANEYYWSFFPGPMLRNR
nr:jerky protein homolog-like [Leptinotarsa decemlineata]